MSSLQDNIRQTLDKLLPSIKKQHQEAPHDPIILGITGLQGSGKSTWASTLVKLLSTEHGLYTVTVSLDDFYKTHEDLVARRDKDANNKLYRTRGQPGTHDEQLAAKFFQDLKNYATQPTQRPLRIPRFDKSRFNGAGDRAPEAQWPTISQAPAVVVFEGWCLGFQPLPLSALQQKHALAQQHKLPVNTPAQHDISHLAEVNENLRRYCDTFMGPRHFHFFIHIDTSDLRNVYAWRAEQEHRLIEERGQGMSDEAVRQFIDGYMPSYEIYLDELRKWFFEDAGRMVRVVLDAERRVERVEVL
ncbi:hypothetical protein ACJQWK_03030 [Exserohilum turcicum]|uniref:Uncharacterized protein n=1 Tax=Exserohilum turcicum (strain 28A) TaxID=671987 RepID=R0KWP8_EXST2|nr:uncharacterized protein SETTUDRAFT_134175 [Exserohilum turcica Et28A]EOA92112.1 hypothetical protein SETTUDRAFT_134175 [Exserohilum turcica Et28A]